jgi:hypothetical protein
MSAKNQIWAQTSPTRARDMFDMVAPVKTFFFCMSPLSWRIVVFGSTLNLGNEGKYHS